MRSLRKRIKHKDCFKDFKHHATSQRNNKKIRSKSIRQKIKGLLNSDIEG